jgi:hypothetical protein
MSMPGVKCVHFWEIRMNSSEDSSGARYATSFKEQLFGGKCDVEVIVDLTSRRTSSVLSMSQFLSSRPVFSISLEGLRVLLRAIQDIKSHKGLLSELLPGATDHQLNCSTGADACRGNVPGPQAPPRTGLASPSGEGKSAHKMKGTQHTHPPLNGKCCATAATLAPFPGRDNAEPAQWKLSSQAIQNSPNARER